MCDINHLVGAKSGREEVSQDFCFCPFVVFSLFFCLYFFLAFYIQSLFCCILSLVFFLYLVLAILYFILLFVFSLNWAKATVWAARLSRIVGVRKQSNGYILGCSQCLSTDWMLLFKCGYSFGGYILGGQMFNSVLHT